MTCGIRFDIGDAAPLEWTIAEHLFEWGASEYIPVHITDLPDYDGQTEFEPSEEAQVIHVAEHTVHEDITIDPIPSNYGRISYSGSVLTVY